MKRFETNKELKQALGKALGQGIAKDLFGNLTSGLHPPYDESDLEEILNNLGIEHKKTSQKKLPEVIRGIAEEVTLWQDIQLRRIEPELRAVRRKLFGTTETMDMDGAIGFLGDFLPSEELLVRPAYACLFIERLITPQDFGRYFEALKPNRYE